MIPTASQRRETDSSNKNNQKTNQIFKCSKKKLEASTTPPIKLKKKRTMYLQNRLRVLKLLKPRVLLIK
jgi:hypothetical protein